MTIEPTDRDVNRLNEVSDRDVRLQDEGKEASTLRNGRPDRIRESKVGRNLAAIAGVYLILVFLVPLALPENTIPDLSGRANRLDYATDDGWSSWGNGDNGEGSAVGHNQPENGGTFAWTDLNPVAALVYAIGDLNCHQKFERSWEINGNQLAVCTRDIGILLGFVGACLLWSRKGLNRWTVRDSFLSIFTDESVERFYFNDTRMRLMLVLLAVGLGPMAIDGFTQLLTDYESTNLLRILTGAPAGFVGGWFFSATFSARPNQFDDAESVKLPADAKLRIV